MPPFGTDWGRANPSVGYGARHGDSCTSLNHSELKSQNSDKSRGKEWSIWGILGGFFVGAITGAIIGFIGTIIFYFICLIPLAIIGLVFEIDIFADIIIEVIVLICAIIGGIVAAVGVMADAIDITS